jgi:Chaperone of endosialidase
MGSVFSDPPSPPPAPDYTGAAQATAAGNLDAARAAAAANRVNQVTPYGNLNYAVTGSDPYGNPTWTATTNLSDVGKQLLGTQNAASLGLGQTINAQLGNVQNVMGQGFNPQTAPITTNVGQANLNPLTGQANLQTQTDYAGGMQGWDKANQLLMARLQPQMEIQQRNLDAQLANQGVVAGTEAYNRAKMGLGMQQNDLLNQAQLSGLSAGNTLFNQGLQGAQFGNAAQQQGYQNTQAQQQANNAIAQQQFGNQLTNANLGNAAQQQQYNQAMTNYNMPLNTLSALRTGAQVQNPTFINAPQQATTAGPDLLGAATAQGNYNTAANNAATAAQSSLTGGLMNLGGTLGAVSLMSDIRTKENIEPIGVAQNGLTVYRYEYKNEFKDRELAGHGVHYGYMAQEVEQVYPYAVRTLDDGYKVVDYGLL